MHVSELADRFVRDASEVAKVGDRLKVRVLAVDLERRRISLSARSRPRDHVSSSRDRRARLGDRGRNQKGSPGQGKFANHPFAGRLKR